MGKDTKNRTKYCIVCGKPFEAETAWQKYCSRKCQSQSYREKRGIRLKDGRFCRQCGIHFVPELGQQNRQHCSVECAKQSARQSRSRFYERNPQKSLEYYAKSRDKHGMDGNMKRFLLRFPDVPSACQSCGETRVLDIAHKPQYRRDGSWRSKKNTTPDKVWILCPTCHALLDRKHYNPADLGLS